MSAKGSVEQVAHMIQQFKSYFEEQMRSQDFVVRDLRQAVRTLWKNRSAHTIWSEEGVLVKQGAADDEFDVYVKVGTIVPLDRARLLEEEDGEEEIIELEEDDGELLDI